VVRRDHRPHGFLGKLKPFRRADQGAVAIYAALLLTLVLALGVLTIDVGRMMILTTQLQNAADAGALAGATQLDGSSGSRDRATSIAATAAARTSSIVTGGTAFSIASTTYYSSINPNVTATGDDNATYIHIVMNDSEMNIFMRPVLDLLTNTGVSDRITINAGAIAKYAPIICNMPPLMVCDPTETLGASADLFDGANVGKQMIIKEAPGGGGLAPGNFGLLCTPAGDCGASAIGDALAAITPDGCTGVQVTTSPGSKTNEVKNGINSRFDTASGTNNPARNVINFPRDSTISPSSTNILGAADWDASTYWSEHHSGAGLPAALSGASRYQTYLYELGETYARNGMQTIYPAPATLPAGYSSVTGVSSVPTCSTYTGALPAGKGKAGPTCDDEDPAYDGAPQSASVNDPKRRVVEAVVLSCIGQNVQGHGSYDTNGRFVQFFVTEAVPDPPDSTIFGELIGGLTETTSSKFHANVALTQ
jgi:Flp pilus assembly protein TadG